MTQTPVGDGNRLEATHETPAFGIGMRQWPDPERPPVASLPGRSPVRVLDQQGTWAEITTATGETGWVYANQLTPLPEGVRGPESPEVWVVGVVVLLAIGLITLRYLMFLPMGLSDPCSGRNPGCDAVAWDAFVVGVCVLVGSFVVAVAAAIWRRRSGLMYLALLGYALAVWLTDWGVDRAVARWPG